MRSRTAALAALVVAAALVAAPASASDGGHEPASSDRVAYAPRSSFSGRGPLTVVDADGTDRVVLPTDAERPRWSPDGTRLAFLRDGDLFVVRPDGTDQDRLTTTGDLGSGPEWSPNGDRLVAASSEQLVLVDPDGTDELRTSPEKFVGGPVWSPDGGRVAYVATDPGYGGRSLVTVAPDGADRRVLLDAATTGFSVSPPAWTPDGTALVVSVHTWTDDRCCQIWRVDADGTGARALTGPDDAVLDTSHYTVDPDPPAVSPDGSLVAFAGPGLFVVPTEGGDVRRVTDAHEGYPQERRPSWSADGRRIAFSAQYSGDSGCHCDPAEPFVADLHGGTVTRLAGQTYGAGLDVVFSSGAARRLAGLDRVGTALALSRAADPELRRGEPAVVLARADDYADALAAAPFAAHTGATLLLTGGDRLDPRVALEIQRLGSRSALLLGSEAALSAQVEADVRALVPEVDRIAGATRFETAEELAYRTRTFPERTFLVQGADADPTRGWPDAVAVGALAAQSNHAILLTYRDDLPAATLRALHTQVTPRVTIVGGTSAVSQAVEERLRAEGFSVDRLAGATRYDTSRLVAEEAFAGFDPGPAAGAADEGHDAVDASGSRHVGLVTGANWPDALAAAASLPYPGLLLLADPGGLGGSPETRDVLVERAAAVADVTLVGGPDVLSPVVEAEVERLLAGR